MCPFSSSTLTVSFPDGINDPSLENYINIYPNPTSSKFFIEIENIQYDSYTITIFDITGKSIYSEKITYKGLLKKEFDLSEYAKGVYSINFTFKNNTISKKIILQ